MRGGTPESEQSLDQELVELEQFVRPRLAPYPVKEPTAEESRNLAERVLLRAQAERGAVLPGNGTVLYDACTPNGGMRAQGEMARDGRSALGHSGRSAKCDERAAPSLGAQVRLQMGTYGTGFWIISVIVFALLVFASAAGPVAPSEQPTNLFSLVLPGYVLAAAAYGHLSGNRSMCLVESVTPFSPALIWLTRILIVAGMNIVLGLAGTGYLALTVHGLQPLPFLLQWLSAVVAVGGFLAWVLFHKGFRWALGSGMVVWAVTAGEQQGLFRTEPGWSHWMNGALLVVGFVLTVAVWRKGYRLSG